MSPERRFAERSYIALKPEFVLKVDGSRPILYVIDDEEDNITILQPVDGLTLSLFNGRRTLGEVRQVLARVLPHGAAVDVAEVLRSVEEAAETDRADAPEPGREGILDVSDRELDEAILYDPRDFVVDMEDYRRRMADPRTRQRLESPINALVVPTHHCFTRCLYCYAERPRATEMPLERWGELLDEMVDLGIYVVSPDNGDVLARPDGMKFLEMLIERKFEFILSTKAHLSRAEVGRLMDAGFADPIRGRVFRDVQLSIDAVDDAISRRVLGVAHSRVRGNEETFTNFLHFGIRPRIKAVITGLNADQVLPIVESYHRLGARRFTFTGYGRSFFRHQDMLFLRGSELDLARRQVNLVRERFPDVNVTCSFGGDDPDISASEGSALAERQDAWDQRSGCGGGWSSIAIAAGGEAFLCEQMVLSDPYVVGDTRTQSIREIWNSERMLNFIFPTREQFAGTICHECPEFEECMWVQGRCYRDAYFSYGSIYQPPPQCPKNDRPGLVDI
jgi:radical SAM protein with 4Fe4S-binding SPASM domain